MAKPKFEMPDLSNATPSFLIDEIGRIRKEESALKALGEFYKTALQARVSPEQLRGSAFVVGENFLGDYEDKSQARIDSDAAREAFTEAYNILSLIAADEKAKAVLDRDFYNRCANFVVTWEKGIYKTIEFKQLNTKPKVDVV